MLENNTRVRLGDIVKSGNVEAYTQRIMETKARPMGPEGEDFLIRNFILVVTNPVNYLKEKEDFMLEVMKHAKKITDEELWRRGVTAIFKKRENQQRVVEIVHNGIKKQVEIHFKGLNHCMFDSFHECVKEGKYKVAKFFAAELMNYRDFIGVRRALSNTTPNEIWATSIINSNIITRSADIAFGPKSGRLTETEYQERSDYLIGLSKIYKEFMAKHKDDIAMPYMMGEFMLHIHLTKYELPLWVSSMMLDMAKAHFPMISHLKYTRNAAFQLYPEDADTHIYNPNLKYDFKYISFFLSYFHKDERDFAVEYFKVRLKEEFSASIKNPEDMYSKLFIADVKKKGINFMIKEFIPKLSDYAEKFEFLRLNGLFDPELRFKNLSGFAELKNICILSKKPQVNFDVFSTAFRVMYGILGSCDQLKAAVICFNKHAVIEGFQPKTTTLSITRNSNEQKTLEL